MSAAIHAWADAGVPALVEAPTGTGKSYSSPVAVSRRPSPTSDQRGLMRSVSRSTLSLCATAVQPDSPHVCPPPAVSVRRCSSERTSQPREAERWARPHLRRARSRPPDDTADDRGGRANP